MQKIKIELKKRYKSYSYNCIYITIYIYILGRKGVEPLKARAIEFTAQPIIPTNGIFLIHIPKTRYISILIFTDIYPFRDIYINSVLLFTQLIPCNFHYTNHIST